MNLTQLFGVPENFAAHGGQVDHMMEVVLWFMLALFVGWTCFLLYCMWRFQRRRNEVVSYHGVRSHLPSHLEIGVVVIEAVLLLGFAFPLWASRADDFERVQAQNPIRARVVGMQFMWTYHYPGADQVFGRIDPDLMNGSNPLGIDPEDPSSADDFIAPILKLAKDRPAILQITSKDVIHNYAIVPMRIQQDAIPGQEIPMWFTPIKELETFVVCAQLCGSRHAEMVGTMEVVSQAAYSEWAAAQSKAALEANTPKDKTAAR
jgi:cytochrome c oxidase subunit 2